MSILQPVQSFAHRTYHLSSQLAKYNDADLSVVEDPRMRRILKAEKGLLWLVRHSSRQVFHLAYKHQVRVNRWRHERTQFFIDYDPKFVAEFARACGYDNGDDAKVSPFFGNEGDIGVSTHRWPEGSYVWAEVVEDEDGGRQASESHFGGDYFAPRGSGLGSNG